MFFLHKILFFVLFLFLTIKPTTTVEASPITRSINLNIFQPSVQTPFSFLKEFKTSLNDNKFSLITDRLDQNLTKTNLYFAFIFFFFLLIIIKLTTPDYFTDLFSCLFKKNYLFAKSPKTKFNISINSIIIDFITLCVVSYFFYQYLYTKYEIQYYLIFGSILAFTVIQILIILFSYNLFFGSGNINIHITNLLISNRIIGIIFTPSLFVITYLNPVYQTIGLYILFFILIIILLVRIYRILNQLKIIYNFSFLFIFLYICTFELSIYFLCFKVVLLFYNF